MTTPRRSFLTVLGNLGGGILVAIVVVSLSLTTVLTIDNHYAGQALRAEQQTFNQEQAGLRQAGRVESQFAAWLVESLSVVHDCTAKSQSTCPPLPPLPNIGKALKSVGVKR